MTTRVTVEERARVVDGIMINGALFKMLPRVSPADQDDLLLTIRYIAVLTNEILVKHNLSPEAGAEWYNEEVKQREKLNVYNNLSDEEQTRICCINEMKHI